MMRGYTFSLRIIILILAGVLAMQAVWLGSAEFIRPMMPYFPQDKASEERVLAAGSRAVTAASIAVVRGDLWTEAAVALSSGLTGEVAGESDPQMTPEKDRAREMAQRAARLSPTDSRTWLLLAALDTRFDWPNREVAGRLKMSYLTGPNELSLTPLRIRI